MIDFARTKDRLLFMDINETTLHGNMNRSRAIVVPARPRSLLVLGKKKLLGRAVSQRSLPVERA